MKIVNKTHWRSDQFRAIIQQVSLTALEGYPRHKRHLVVTITYSRNQGTHRGEAVLFGFEMTLWVPKDRVDSIRFAWLVDHEMGHIRGLQHKGMTLPELYFDHYPVCKEVNQSKYDWASGFPIQLK